LIGKTIDGRYTILRQIGAGGMGAVYEAKDGDGRRVALKVIKARDIAEDSTLMSRFKREARLASSIDPKTRGIEHVARVFDTGVDKESGLPFMAMELLVGRDLMQTLRKVGPLPPDVALRVVAQACRGLVAAHGARVVHRDIKSANLFLARDVGDDGAVRSDAITIKLLDFGVAKERRDEQDLNESAGLTRTGSVLGSPLFMAPEQARGVKNVDARADLWSLGIVAYHALAGRTPYQEIDALGELIIALCAANPPSVQSFAPWVDPDIAELLDGALQIDPERRYSTAAAMLDATLNLLARRGGADAKTNALDALTEAMIAPVSGDVRALAADRYAPGEPRAQSVGGESAPGSVAPRHTSTNGVAGDASSLSIAAPPRSSLPLALGLSLALVGGAGIAYFAIGKAPDPVAPAHAEAPSSLAPTTPTTLSATAAPSAFVTPTPVTSASAPASSSSALAPSAVSATSVAKPRPKPTPSATDARTAAPLSTEGFGDRR
jgi:serine/threonine-protein kinase